MRFAIKYPYSQVEVSGKLDGTFSKKSHSSDVTFLKKCRLTLKIAQEGMAVAPINKVNSLALNRCR
jgi:hypothetical protein